jgi:hypothetical protein
LTARDIGMVPLGHGKYARAIDIVALIPIEDGERGQGRRTYVHIAGLDGPIVASRSERAILADMERSVRGASGYRPSMGVDSAHPAPADERVRRPRRWRRPNGRRAATGGRQA